MKRALLRKIVSAFIIIPSLAVQIAFGNLAMLPAAVPTRPLLPAVSSPATQLGMQVEPLSLRSLANSISSHHALINDVFDGGVKNRPPVIVVQDVHLNAEAQANIAGILKGLMEEDRIDAVGIEGAFEPFNFAPFRIFPDKEISKRVASAYLQKNLIAGPAYAAITSRRTPPAFFGVDDRDHYQANVDATLASRKGKEKIAKELERARARLAEAKRNIFSAKLKEFDALWTAHNKGDVGFGAYVKKLSTYVSTPDLTVEQFLAAYDMERRLDFTRVERERKSVLEKLSRALSSQEVSALLDQSVAYQAGRIGFGAYYRDLRELCGRKGIQLGETPAFDAYVRYVLLSDGIKADALFAAVREMERGVQDALAVSPEEKRLVRESIQLNLASKLINFELTPDEWEEYVASVHSPWTIDHRPNLSSFERFYREADIRSDKMISNLLSVKSSKGRVLVVGGFHSPRLTQLLREKGVPYLVVSPKVSKAGDGPASSYLSIFAREKTPLDKVFAGEKLFINPSIVAGVGTPAGIETNRKYFADNAARQVQSGAVLPKDAPMQAEPDSGSIYRATDGDKLEVLVDTSKEPGDGFTLSPWMWTKAVAGPFLKSLRAFPSYVLQMATPEDEVDKTLRAEEGNELEKDLAAAGVDEGFLPELARELAGLHFDIKALFPRKHFTLRDLMQLSRFIRINAERLGIGGAALKGTEFVYGGRLSSAERKVYEGLLADSHVREKLAKFGVRFEEKKKIIGVERAQQGLAGYIEFLTQDFPEEAKVFFRTPIDEIESADKNDQLKGLLYIAPLAFMDDRVKKLARERFRFLNDDLDLDVFSLMTVVEFLNKFKNFVAEENWTDRVINSSLSKHIPEIESFVKKSGIENLRRLVEKGQGRLSQEPEPITAVLDPGQFPEPAAASPGLLSLDPVYTENLVANMEAVAFAAEGNFPMLLEGATALGKSFAIKVVAAWRKQPLAAVGMHQALTSYELIGGYHPGEDGRLEWKEGFLIKAMREGKWLVLEELNLAPTEVLEVLNLYLVHGKLIVDQGGDRTEYSLENGNIHPDFRLFATMNPVETGGGRNEISEALMDRFIRRRVALDDVGLQVELAAMAQKKLGLEPGWAQSLAKLHVDLANKARLWGKPLELKEPYNFNPRHLLRIAPRLDPSKDIALQLAGIVWEIYGDQLRYPVRKDDLFELMDKQFDLTQRGITRESVENFLSQSVTLESLHPGPMDSELKHSRMTPMLIPGPEHELAPTASVRRVQSKIHRSLMAAEKMGKPEHVALSGPPASSKTSVIFDLYRQLRLPLHYINLHGSMDLESLVGGPVPTDVGGRYRYQPGPLVQAMENGEAIFLDEMNLSQMPEWFNTVLDEGILYLPGRAEPVRARKGFVVLAAVNPATQEGRQVMSAPLRTRFHEMWVDEIKDPEELKDIVSFRLGKKGVGKADLVAGYMILMHVDMRTLFPKAGYGLRTLLHWADFVAENHQSMRMDNAFDKGLQLHYGGGLNSVQRQEIAGAAGTVTLNLPQDFFGFLTAMTQGLPKETLDEMNDALSQIQSNDPNKQRIGHIRINSFIKADPTGKLKKLWLKNIQGMTPWARVGPLIRNGFFKEAFKLARGKDRKAKTLLLGKIIFGLSLVYGDDKDLIKKRFRNLSKNKNTRKKLDGFLSKKHELWIEGMRIIATDLHLNTGPIALSTEAQSIIAENVRNLLQPLTKVMTQGSAAEKIQITEKTVKIGDAELPLRADARTSTALQDIPDLGRLKPVTTPKLVEAMETVAFAAKGNFPLLFDGNAALGKSFAIKVVAGLVGQPLAAVGMHQALSSYEAIGGYRPKGGKLVWQDGFLIEAMRKGRWLVLEELNMAPSEVLEALNLFLTQKRIVYWRDGKQVELSYDNGGIGPNFRLFATMNPAEMGGGRMELSQALMSRLVLWKVDLSLDDLVNEWREILMAKFGFEQGLVEQVLLVQKALMERRNIWVKGASANEKYEFNLRTLLRLARRLERREQTDGVLFKDMDGRRRAVLVAAEIEEVYGDMLRESSHRDEFYKDVLDKSFNLTEAGISREEIEAVYADQKNRGPGLGIAGTTESELAPVASTLRFQGKLSRSLEMDEHALLTGPTGAGKTSLVLDLFRRLGRDIHYYNMHGSASMDELIGTSLPTGRPGEYEFVPGLLVLAMRAGIPILIDEMNLSELPEWFNTVLDEGVLWLEDGGKVTAKPGFTVIGAMNPPTAEYTGRNVFSPALRSRFREIWVDEITDPKELEQIVRFKLGKTGAEGLTEQLVTIHQKLRSEFPKAKFGLRRLLRVAEAVKTFSGEMGRERSVARGFDLLYRNKLPPAGKEKFDDLAKKEEAFIPFWSVKPKKISRPTLKPAADKAPSKEVPRTFGEYVALIAANTTGKTQWALESAVTLISDSSKEDQTVGLTMLIPLFAHDDFIKEKALEWLKRILKGDLKKYETISHLMKELTSEKHFADALRLAEIIPDVRIRFDALLLIGQEQARWGDRLGAKETFRLAGEQNPPPIFGGHLSGLNINPLVLVIEAQVASDLLEDARQTFNGMPVDRNDSHYWAAKSAILDEETIREAERLLSHGEADLALSNVSALVGETHYKGWARLAEASTSKIDQADFLRKIVSAALADVDNHDKTLAEFLCRIAVVQTRAGLIADAKETFRHAMMVAMKYKAKVSIEVLSGVAVFLSEKGLIDQAALFVQEARSLLLKPMGESDLIEAVSNLTKAEYAAGMSAEAWKTLPSNKKQIALRLLHSAKAEFTAKIFRENAAEVKKAVLAAKALALDTLSGTLAEGSAADRVLAVEDADAPLSEAERRMKEALANGLPQTPEQFFGILRAGLDESMAPALKIFEAMAKKDPERNYEVLINILPLIKDHPFLVRLVRSWSVRIKNPHHRVSVLMKVAEIYLKSGEQELVAPILLEALGVAEKMPTDVVEISWVVADIAKMGGELIDPHVRDGILSRLLAIGRTIEIDWRKIYSLTQIAKAYGRQKQLGAVEQVLSEVQEGISRSPLMRHPTALADIADVHFSMGNDNEGNRLLSEALSASKALNVGDRVYAHLDIAKVYVEYGHELEAVAMLTSALQLMGEFDDDEDKYFVANAKQYCVSVSVDCLKLMKDPAIAGPFLQKLLTSAHEILLPYQKAKALLDIASISPNDLGQAAVLLDAAMAAEMENESQKESTLVQVAKVTATLGNTTEAVAFLQSEQTKELLEIGRKRDLAEVAKIVLENLKSENGDVDAALKFLSAALMKPGEGVLSEGSAADRVLAVEDEEGAVSEEEMRVERILREAGTPKDDVSWVELILSALGPLIGPVGETLRELIKNTDPEVRFKTMMGLFRINIPLLGRPYLKVILKTASQITDELMKSQAFSQVAKAMAPLDKIAAAAILKEAEQMVLSMAINSDKFRALLTVAQVMPALDKVRAAAILINLIRTVRTHTNLRSDGISQVAQATMALDKVDAGAILEIAVEVARETRDEKEKSRALSAVAQAMVVLDPTQAILILKEAEQAARRIDDHVDTLKIENEEIRQLTKDIGTSHGLAAVGQVMVALNKDEAARLLKEAAETARKITMDMEKSHVLSAVAQAMAAIDVVEAAQIWNEAAQTSDRITNLMDKYTAGSLLAQAMAVMDKAQASRTMKEAADAVLRETNDYNMPYVIKTVVKDIGLLEKAEAEIFLKELLDATHKLTDQWGKSQALLAVADASGVLLGSYFPNLPEVQSIMEILARLMNKSGIQTAAEGSAADRVLAVEEKRGPDRTRVGTLYLGETSLPILSDGPGNNVPDFDKLDPVETKSLIDMMEVAALGVRLKKMVVYVGDAALGKSFAIKVLAANKSKNRDPKAAKLHTGTNHPYRAVGMHPAITTYEMMGGYHPTSDGPAGQRVALKWRPGFLVEAAEKGEWLVLEELNLASSEILEVLNYYLVFGRLRVLKEGRWVEIKVHPDFHLFATMNPDDYQGRMKISDALMDRMIEVQVALSADQQMRELVDILMVKFGLQEGRAKQIVNFHLDLADQAGLWRGRYASKEPYKYTLRHLLRLGERLSDHVVRFAKASAGVSREDYQKFTGPQKSAWMEKWRAHFSDENGALRAIAAEMWEVYGEGLRDPEYRPALFEMLSIHFGLRDVGIRGESELENYFPWEDLRDESVDFDRLLDFYPRKDLINRGLSPSARGIAVTWAGGVPLLRGEGRLAPVGETLAHVPSPSARIPIVPATLKTMGKIARSLFRGENVLLVGGTGVGKTSLIFEMFRRLNRPIYYINFHNGVNIEELVGGQHLTKTGFVFKRGVLAKAMEAGAPLYIDELNLSDMPEWFNTVLDDGILWMPDGSKVTAKSSFMIVAAMNPPNVAGRHVLSPALRSRFREIWVDEITDKEQVAGIIQAALNGIGKVLFGYADTWGRAIKHAAREIFKGERFAMLVPKETGGYLKWGLESVGQAFGFRLQGLRLDALTSDESKIIEAYAKEHLNMDPGKIKELQDKAKAVKASVEAVVRMMGSDRKVSVSPGRHWAYHFDSNTVTYPIDELLTRNIDHIIGTALHEGSHRDISRINPEDELFTKVFYGQETTRMLMNVFEDPRVNIWSTRKFMGAGHYIKNLYEVEFPKEGMPKWAEGYKGSLIAQSGIQYKEEGQERGKHLPYMQYGLGVIYWWLHRDIPEFVTDPDAIQALNDTSQHFDAIFEGQTLPAEGVTKVSEIEKMDFATKHAQMVRDLILPTYEKLLEKSRAEIAQMIKDGKLSLEGRPGDGHSVEIPPELLSEAAKKILEGNAGKFANSIEGKMDIPKVRETKEKAKQGGSKPASAPVKPKDLSKAPSAIDLIENAMNAEQAKQESMTPYQKFLEPVADIVDRLRGRLGNYLFPNSRPRDIGWFRSGKPNIPRIMQSEARGWTNESDFKVFTRRTVPTKRNHRFSLVIDQSGSMSGEKAKKAMETLVLFMETLEYLGVDYNIIGFSDAPSEYKGFAGQLPEPGREDHDVPRGKLDEDKRTEVVNRTELGNNSGSTNDKDALVMAIDRIVRESADRKVMIVITDGAGTNGPISAEIQQALQAGVRVIAIPIDTEAMNYVKNNYGAGNHVPIAQLDDLPEALGTILEEEFTAEDDTSPAIQSFIQSRATIPAVVWMLDRIAGRRAAQWYVRNTGEVETLLFGLLPVLLLGSLLAIFAPEGTRAMLDLVAMIVGGGMGTLFAVAHLGKGDYLADAFQIRAGRWKVLLVSVLHLLAASLTVVAFIHPVVFVVAAAAWAGAWRTHRTVNAVLPSQPVAAATAHLFNVVDNTGVDLEVRNLVPEKPARRMFVGPLSRLARQLSSSDIVYAFLDESDEITSLATAQRRLDLLAGSPLPVRIGFVAESATNARFLREKLKIPSHVKVDVFERSEAKTLGGLMDLSLSSGFLSEKDLQIGRFRFLVPKSMQGLLENFAGPRDLDEERYRFYLLITDTLNPLTLEVSRSQLGNLKALIELVGRQA